MDWDKISEVWPVTLYDPMDRSRMILAMQTLVRQLDERYAIKDHKHDLWIHGKDDRQEQGVCECDKGRQDKWLWWMNDLEWGWIKFCPWCGLKLKGGA